MTGPKLNEAEHVAGESSGTKAVGRYVRSSAKKVRPVLDLIRGKDVKRADEILQFTDREAARLTRKVLASAVANAIENSQQDADDLFVKACFADEGPTLKRFRPRARGRAGKINKRTAHITVVVARMSDEQMVVREAKAGSRGSALVSRRARVEASRQRAAKPAAQEAPQVEEPAADVVDVAADEVTSEE
jgi:large subunit ribosomal protein L22